MRKLLSILALSLFAGAALAAPPTDHDGTGDQTYTLDWSTMVTETNPSTARHRIIDGTTEGSWVTWADPWADVVLDIPVTVEDVTIQLEVTDLAGRKNAFATDQLVIAYAAAASDCPSGTYILAWDGDHGDGTNRICHTSGAGTITGTVNGSATISSTYGESGSNGILIDTVQKGIIFTQTGDQYADPGSNQTVWMRIYLTGAPAVNDNIFEFRYDNSHRALMALRTDRRAVGSYVTTGVNQSVWATGTLSTEAWIDVAYSWNISTGTHSAYFDGSWKDDANEVTSAMVEAVTDIKLGPSQVQTTSLTNSYYIDRMYVLSGHKTTKPW